MKQRTRGRKKKHEQRYNRITFLSIVGCERAESSNVPRSANGERVRWKTRVTKGDKRLHFKSLGKTKRFRVRNAVRCATLYLVKLPYLVRYLILLSSTRCNCLQLYLQHNSRCLMWKIVLPCESLSLQNARTFKFLRFVLCCCRWRLMQILYRVFSISFARCFRRYL